MPKNLQEFQIKKIKGDFAELICKHHFELMGCHVNKVGIEELSPTFAKLNSSKKAVESLKARMQYMPDFLVVHPTLQDASFIEVKYRKNINDNASLKSLSLELHEKYSDFIKDDTPIYFYLLTNKSPFIHIMKANALKYWEHTGGFYPVGENALDRLPFFRGNNDNRSFNDVYMKSIKPAIVDILVK